MEPLSFSQFIWCGDHSKQTHKDLAIVLNQRPTKDRQAETAHMCSARFVITVTSRARRARGQGPENRAPVPHAPAGQQHRGSTTVTSVAWSRGDDNVPGLSGVSGSNGEDRGDWQSSIYLTVNFVVGHQTKKKCLEFSIRPRCCHSCF